MYESGRYATETPTTGQWEGMDAFRSAPGDTSNFEVPVGRGEEDDPGYEPSNSSAESAGKPNDSTPEEEPPAAPATPPIKPPTNDTPALPAEGWDDPNDPNDHASKEMPQEPGRPPREELHYGRAPDEKGIYRVVVANQPREGEIAVPDDSTLADKNIEVVVHPGPPTVMPEHLSFSGKIDVRDPVTGQELLRAEAIWSATQRPRPSGVVSLEGKQEIEVPSLPGADHRSDYYPPNTIRVDILPETEDPKEIADTVEVMLRAYVDDTVERTTVPTERPGWILTKHGMMDSGTAPRRDLEDALLGENPYGIVCIQLNDYNSNLASAHNLNTTEVQGVIVALNRLGCDMVAINNVPIERSQLRRIDIRFQQRPERVIEGDYILPTDTTPPSPKLPETGDPELNELIRRGVEVLGVPAIGRILQASERYLPLGVRARVREDGTQVEEPYMPYKDVLGDLPDYARTAQAAGLTPGQAADILAHALDTGNPELWDARWIVPNVGRALSVLAENGGPVALEHLDALRALTTKSGEYDVTIPSLSAFVAGCKAGLSVEESKQVVQEYLDTAGPYVSDLNSAILYFRDALRALDNSGVEPALIKEVFERVRQKPPGYQPEMYENIKIATTLGGMAGVDPTEILRNASSYLRRGESSPTELPGSAPESAANEMLRSLDRETYFREAAGPLENRVLPYRSGRTWEEGVKDISRLADESPMKGAFVSEGNWVFDPIRGTWYSLGAPPTFRGASRYERDVPYDVSALCSNPVSVHSHPGAFLVGTALYKYFLPNEADYQAVATTLESAQMPITMRSFIAHPMGITEFTYPSDSAAIRRLAAEYEEVLDSFFWLYRDENEVFEAVRAVGAETFLDNLVTNMNQALPKGFTIKHYPKGVIPEVLRGRGAVNEEPQP